MVQISTPWGDPNRGMGPPWGAFLSNYFDLLFKFHAVILTDFEPLLYYKRE